MNSLFHFPFQCQVVSSGCDQQRAAADGLSTKAIDTTQQPGHDELAYDLTSAEPTVDATGANRAVTEAELKTTIATLQQRCSELGSAVAAANEAIERLKADGEASVTKRKNQVTTLSELAVAAELKHKHEVSALRQRCTELETQLCLTEEAAQAHREHSATAPRQTATTDGVEQQQREYDDLNEQIILNQQALDRSILQLVQQPPDDEEEETRLHDANEEMQMILDEEWKNRRRTVAKLVLHQWRPDRHQLETWTKINTMTDDESIQHTCHNACFELSSEIAMLNERCEQLQCEEEATRDAFARARRQLEERHGERLHQYKMLLHADQRLRQHVLEYCTRAEDSSAVVYGDEVHTT